ncbi:protein CASP-like [Clavelina lepadiformis]|uniref:protein CASP-like n=1 Tax=Clavelina lepadiformis TaxID=159417 RepID=UPI00404338CF
MAVNIASVLQFWRTFDLPQMQRNLDQPATNIATRQDESEASRRKLVEQMKLFKKSSTEDVRKTVAPLLKSFQTEIDSLTKRSKACETDFLNLYKKLIELPDPVIALDQAESYQKKNQRLNDIETENQKLRETLAEYNKEFAEVKNQEVTIKTLKEKVKDLERDTDNRAQRVIEEKHEELNKEFVEREKRLHDAQFAAATKLTEAEQKVMTVQSALDASQSELFNLKCKYDEETAAKHAELEIIISDLDRANQINEISAKEIEALKEQLASNFQVEQSVTQQSFVEHSIEVSSRVNLEVELAAKEKEISQFVEDIQHLQSSMIKLRETSAVSIAKLEQEIDAKVEKCAELEAKLQQQSDYQEVKRELSILRSTEFSGLSKEAKSLEVLLLDKNRALQNENTGLRAANSQLTEFSKTLENKLAMTEETKIEQQTLIHKLETDLMMVQSPASVVRSAADGSPAPPATNMSGELVADAISQSPGTDNSNSSLLLVVSSQRERFRVRNNELEAENYTHQQTIQRLQNELDTLRADNIKLYEKIKFLQSYPTSSKVPIEDVTSSRYSSQYEDNLDPFTSFNRKEKQRKYMNLSPPEKVTLGIGRMILSSKLARTIFFFYMLFMHLLLYVILYRYAYSDDKRHITDLCYEKFGPQMAPDKH